jgi:hypothetical protein
MRYRQRLIDRVRRFNKRFFNPLILRTAGTPRSPFSVVGHTGRRTGTSYSTPVIAVPLEQPHCADVRTGCDWYQNILASGQCTLRWRGKTYNLTQPRIISLRVGLGAFPAIVAVMLRLARKRDFFQMAIRQDEQTGGQAA